MTAPQKQAPDLVTLLGIGVMFGVCVGIGVFAGVLGDDAAGTSPLLALAGTLVGILGGAAGAFQAIRPYTRQRTTPASPTGTRPTDPEPARPAARPDDDVRSDER